jgi:chaperonin GroES
MTSIKPLGRNILVQIAESKEMTNSGIVLPDSEKESAPQEGTVVAIGESKDINSEIKNGVTVVFRQFSGDKVISNDMEYIVLDAKKDVVAIIA